MKRIITAAGLAVTVFFTGCSSLAGSMEVDYREIQTSVAAEVATDENGENRLGITEEDKEMPDYFRDNVTERLKSLGGRPAFRIKDGHSREPEDMEWFQTAGLRADKTFIYGYGTRESSGKMVHCAAFYNYETERFQVFHENVYDRRGETAGEKESFFIQVCEPGGDIFVYDNGWGSLYDGSGRLKFQSDIETFIRKQFFDVFSVSVIHAVTDGQNRIYLEISIEKEEIPIPEGEETDWEFMREGDLEEETDELDENLAEKMETRILVYEYRPISSGMDQRNDAFEDQKRAWTAQTEGREYTTPPDGPADWEKVREDYPDLWGGAYLGGMDDIRVYQWKGEPAFTKEEGVTSFLPQPDTYVNFRDVKENWFLKDLFIPVDNKYSDLFGKTKSFIYYEPQTIERQYTLVWEEEEEQTGGDSGGGTVRHEEVHTQAIGDIRIKRYAPLENAYVESYWVMNPEQAVSLGICVNGQIQCTGQDQKVRWIQPGGSLKDTPYKVTEETQAGAFVENGTVYHVEYGRDFMSVVQDQVHGGQGEPVKILYKKLAGSYEAGDSVHDAILEKKYEEDLPQVEKIYGNDFYTEDQVIRAGIRLDQALADRLREKGAGGLCTLAGGDSADGFLLTSGEKGLLYYAPGSEKSVVLEEGSWFRSWKLGENYVSIGFPEGEALYSGNDQAFARVYEYDLSELCNETMARSLEEILAREEQESKEEESRNASESGTETETREDPLKTWDEKYKDKYAQTYPSDESR